MSEQQQFNALEILDFLNKFATLYRKYYNEAVRLIVERDGNGIILAKIAGPGELHVEHSESQRDHWIVWLDVHMLKDVRAKPEIMRLCHSLMPKDSTMSMLPEADAKGPFGINRLMDLLEKEIPEANIKRHDPHHADGLVYVDIRMNGKHVVVVHSIVYGFGISHINPDVLDFTNAPDELNNTVSGTAERVKQLLKNEEHADG